MTASTDAMAASEAGATVATSGLDAAMSAAGPQIAVVVAVIAAAPVVVIALADAFGTLIAIVADFVAPITLVTGLLGGLGLGFAFAAMKAFGQHGSLHDALGKVKHQFDNLTTTLAHDFMPIFTWLISSAHQALTYLNQIAQLPLDKAFKSLATTGVQAVTKFLQHIGSILAHPFRLAIKLAFGAGPAGNEVASAVAGIWHQFTRYMLGYADTHPVFAKDGKFLGVTTTTVQGALQPLIDWFNRHHFTKQGTKIGHEILNGLKPLSKPFGQFIVHVFEDAIKTVATSTWNWLEHGWIAFEGRVLRTELHWAGQVMRGIERLLGQAWDWVKTKAEGIWSSIVSNATNFIGNIKSAIESNLGAAWNWVLGEAQRIWNKIVGIFTAPLHIHLSIPSIPSVGSVLGGLNPFASHAASNTASVAGGGGGGGVVVVHNHFHSVDLTNRADLERVAAKVGDAITRRQSRLVGG